MSYIYMHLYKYTFKINRIKRYYLFSVLNRCLPSSSDFNIPGVGVENITSANSTLLLLSQAEQVKIGRSAGLFNLLQLPDVVPSR